MMMPLAASMMTPDPPEISRGVPVVVEDDGPGLADDIKGRIFEPFATTKPVGEGTGLGLYTSYMLARGMGGELALDDRPPRGARASLLLPA